MRRFGLIVVLCLVAFSLPKGWKELRGPSLRLLYPVEKKSSQSKTLDLKTNSALDQSFFSWGRGSQSEVFLSQDGKWVLKIPRNKKTRPYLLGRFRSQERKGCLESYLRARRDLSDETAVLYVHAGEAIEMPKGFGLYDCLGRRLPMRPDVFPFALQEKKPLLAKRLAEAADPEEAKKMLSSLLDLIEAERVKGWVCSDYAFELNLGYDQGRAFRIDIGSYVPADASFSWEAIAKPVNRFLERSGNAELRAWWDQEISKKGSL